LYGVWRLDVKPEEFSRFLLEDKESFEGGGNDRNAEVYLRRGRDVQQRNILTSAVTNLWKGMMRWQRCYLLRGERI
jgi:hypothetical protein